jgi:integrase/recombinase XerD
VELLERFFTYLSVEKGLSKNTLSSYATDLKRYTLFLSEREKDVTAGLRSDIVDFIEGLRSDGYSIPSVCRYLSSVKALYKYLLIENIIEIDPAGNIQMPKKWERLPKALSIAEVMDLLHTRFAGKTVKRDSSMLELLYSSGLRVSELVKINLVICILMPVL